MASSRVFIIPVHSSRLVNKIYNFPNLQERDQLHTFERSHSFKFRRSLLYQHAHCWIHFRYSSAPYKQLPYSVSDFYLIVDFERYKILGFCLSGGDTSLVS